MHVQKISVVCYHACVGRKMRHPEGVRLGLTINSYPCQNSWSYPAYVFERRSLPEIYCPNIVEIIMNIIDQEKNKPTVLKEELPTALLACEEPKNTDITTTVYCC